jgi:hypothetical protein
VIRAHRLEAVVDAGWASSVRWLQDEIRAGRISAVKIGRHWVMTDDDINAFIESRRNTNRPPPQPRPTGLVFTPTTERRRLRTAL